MSEQVKMRLSIFYAAKSSHLLYRKRLGFCAMAGPHQHVMMEEEEGEAQEAGICLFKQISYGEFI